ncbi:MAG: c-type cytochrome [Betaproteobacteria bacterium]|nr:c-type cytochrome [Betaproteobacteria bacterium]
MTKTKTLLALALIGVCATASARGDIEMLARTCNGCHGVGGVSVGLSMPSIGGLPKEYLRNIMKQWKYDERSAITMNRIVKGLSDDEIDALAAHFAKQRWVPAPQQASAALLAKGKSAISENCEDCHGFTGSDPDVDAPRINGQWAKYMELELAKYRDPRFKMPHRKMKKAAQDMKPAEVPAAAGYFGAQDK